MLELNSYQDNITLSDSLNYASCLSNSSVPSQAGGWGIVGKRSVKASASLVSLWTPPLRGDVSLEASKSSHTLLMSSTYGKHNVSLTAALNNVDKVSGDTGPCLRWVGVFDYTFFFF